MILLNLLASYQGFTEPPSDKLLPDLLPEEQHVFTLVLDLNETLVYSDWKVVFIYANFRLCCLQFNCFYMYIPSLPIFFIQRR